MATYGGNWKDNTTSLRKMKFKEVKRTVNILLLGKTGGGKSATGNTLLKRNAFKSTSSKSSVTEESTLECSIVDGVLIRVVDTPGLMDTNTSIEKTLGEIGVAMSLCPEGFNAILFVMPWNERFTEESMKTLKLLQKSFGDEFITNYCIIAMTKGETFEDEVEDLKFSEWLELQEEPPEFYELINDCQKRVVLFSNKGKGTKFEEERKKSFKHVFDIIKTMLGRYTSEDFDRCAKERERLSVKFNLPAQKQYVQQELSLINQDIQETRSIIDQMEEEESEEGVNELQKSAYLKYQQLEERISLLIEKITYDDKGTGVMKELLTEVKSYLKKIKDFKYFSITEQRKCLLNLEKKVLLKKQQSTGWGAFLYTALATISGAIGGAVLGAGAAIAAPLAAVGAAVSGLVTVTYQLSKK